MKKKIVSMDGSDQVKTMEEAISVQGVSSLACNEVETGEESISG